MHYTLRGGFGAAKVDFDVIEESKAGRGFESGEEEGDIFEASEEDLDQNGDRHGGVSRKEGDWATFAL